MNAADSPTAIMIDKSEILTKIKNKPWLQNVDKFNYQGDREVFHHKAYGCVPKNENCAKNKRRPTAL